MNQIKKLDDSNLFLNSDDLVLKEVIGLGQSSRVYKGYLKLKNSCMPVAVKQPRMKYKETVSMVNERIYEEHLVFYKFKHRNICKCVGLCKINHDGLIHLVMEYAQGGCLYSFLDDLKFDLPIDVVLNWALQICHGMIYLHENNIIHCDLKARNILLDRHPKTKDQMLKTVLKISNISHFSLAGTATHMAPETMRNVFTKKSDVRSFYFSKITLVLN